MKRIGLILLIVGLAWSAAARQSHAVAIWSTGYYAGWMQSYMPPAAIDYSAVSHVIHFSLIPNSDGTLDSSTNMLSQSSAADLISRAHAVGSKVIVCVGGEGSAGGFRGATTAVNIQKFVANIVNIVTSWGYDGVDIDWETLESGDSSQFAALIDDLRSSLNGLTPSRLLTVAVATQPALVASLQSQLDQINLMTYALSGPWTGWVTWFNSPIYDGGYRFSSTDGLVPSIDGMISTFVNAGVAEAKLGVGMDFYGFVWAGGTGTSTGGATAPRQSWQTPPTVYGIPYYSVMANYSQPPYLYFWDAAAQAAYISFDDTGSANDKFISYDDPTAVGQKVQYAVSRGLGGVMIWELAGGYRADQPAGQRDPLLQAVKQALGSSTPTASPTPTPTAPLPTPTPTFTTAVTPTPTPTRTATPSSTPTPVIAASPTPTPTPAAALWVYQDALAAPWINASWKATVRFNNTSPVYAGTRSIKVVESGWGALSVQNGSWSATKEIDPSVYSSVEFQVYSGSAGFNLAVRLERDSGVSFPEIVVGILPTKQWIKVSVPMSQLNPGGQLFDRLDIRDYSGTSRTYFVDSLRLVGK